MLQSVEVRWFGDRPLAARERSWFESLADPSRRRDEERIDRYLELPGVSDLGLKFRGDSGVDFKARTERIGTVELRLSPTVIAGGDVESWVKWSYEGAEYLALGAALSRLDVIEVRKRRSMYLFELPEGDGSGSQARMVDLAADPYPEIERGMALELAEIECAGKTVWTLGLEAFPGGPNLGSDMLAGVLPWLRGCPLELTRAGSSGYPAWLVSLGAS
jgi:hypothetical protein